ncbi:MAG: endolytic transglycosylase MltG [Lachnospiraceae bacterium]|nr:endolytic transglycosylase MltG [Lachnospiraceae bacterium]
MRGTKKFAWFVVKTVFGIVILAVIMMLVYRFALDAYDYGYRIFDEKPMSPEPGLTMSVAIVEGKSVSEIGKILEDKGLIRSGTLFYLQEMFSSYHKKLQPGVYELSTAMTPEEIMALMSADNGSSEDEGYYIESTTESSEGLLMDNAGDDESEASEGGGDEEDAGDGGEQ